MYDFVRKAHQPGSHSFQCLSASDTEQLLLPKLMLLLQMLIQKVFILLPFHQLDEDICLLLIFQVFRRIGLSRFERMYSRGRDSHHQDDERDQTENQEIDIDMVFKLT